MTPKTSRPCIWSRTSISKSCFSTRLTHICRAKSCVSYSRNQRLRRSERVIGRNGVPSSACGLSAGALFCRFSVIGSFAILLIPSKSCTKNSIPPSLYLIMRVHLLNLHPPLPLPPPFPPPPPPFPPPPTQTPKKQWRLFFVLSPRAVGV